MRIIRLLTLIAFAIVIMGCSKAQKEEVSVADSAAQTKAKEASKYLAYIHRLNLAVDREKVATAHTTLTNACDQDTVYSCVILDSSLSVGDYANADIKLRMLPAGIPHFIKLIDQQGDIVARSSSAEDLGDKIVDSTKRIEMLESYRNKLLALEAKPDGDINALVTIASELAKVQNDLEYAQGKRQKLLKRVENDILLVNFNTPYNYSFWSPINDSFDEFGENLSDGIATVITFSAYVIPWGLFLILLFFLLRKVWRFARRK